jgi:peptidoglycan pentaglycine glycine transferase (the first glycine)
MSLDRYVMRSASTTEWKKWDQFVDNHPGGHFLQSWGWGELKASVGWHPFRYSLWDEKQGRVVAAAQVLCRPAPVLPLRVGHLAYIPKGPVIDWSDASLCQAFFTQLNTQLQRRGALALRMEPNRVVNALTISAASNPLPASPLATKVPVAHSHVEELPAAALPISLYPVLPLQPIRSIILDLTPSEDALLAGMKEKWRYNLRLAQRKGVTMRAAETLKDVETWYALLRTTGERDHFGIHTLDYYQKAWHIFAPGRQACLFLAEYDGRLLAGIFVAVFAGQAIYLYGASSNEHRNLMPNYLLQWEAICWSKRQGAVQYDFWGIPETDSEREAMAGVYRFKRGWGGNTVRFVGCYEHTYRPLTMRIARQLLPISIE